MKPVVGHAYQLKEPDYQFGVGTVLLIVTRVVEQIEYDREPWWWVEGRVAIGTVDHHGGWQHREFIGVRAASLRRSMIRVTDAR